MSSNNRIINPDSYSIRNIGGYVIDFDNNIWNHMLSDSIRNIINVDFQRREIKVLPDTTRYKFKIYEKDSIECQLHFNTMSVFRPLNLNHKINKTKKQIFDYLTQNKFENLRDSISIVFSKSFHPSGNTNELRELHVTDYGVKVLGYWYLGEMDSNYFLFFSTGNLENKNIYQIVSINSTKIELGKIQENEIINGIKELKTCL